MAIQTHTITIGEHTYAVTQLTAMRSMRLQMRLGKALGGALPRLFGALVSTGAAEGEKGGLLGRLGELDMERVNFDALGSALHELFVQLDPDTFQSLVLELLSTTEVDGKQPMSLALFDGLFSGAEDEAWRLIAFAMEVQYGDFFGRLLGIGKRRLAASRSRASSTSSTSGLAGAS